MTQSDLSAAELLLSFVGQPGTAASVVGDLAEEFHDRSRTRFWISVFRTFASTIARDLTDEPWRMLKSTACAWGTWALLVLIMIQIAAPIQTFIMRSGGGIQVSPHEIDPPTWILPTLNVLGYFLLFYVAWKVAKRSMNREIAATAACVLFRVILHDPVLVLSAMQERRIGRPYPNVHNTDFLLETALFLAAAILSRVHTLTQRHSLPVQTLILPPAKI